MDGERRVLVVEDDPDIREMIAECLRDCCTVQVAEDAVGALQLLMRQDFDAVVLDHELPGMSGASLIAELGRRGMRIPTLMVSATPNASLVAKKAHADFISKPFDVERLEAKVELLLAGKRATVPPNRATERPRPHVSLLPHS